MSATTVIASPRPAASRTSVLKPPSPRTTRPSGSARASRPALRLTARGRLTIVVVVAVTAFLVIVLGQAIGAFNAQAGAGSSSDAAATWVVQPGETLWSIAEQVAPGSDPRDTVDRLVAMNDLSTSSVSVGQEIFVPA